MPESSSAAGSEGHVTAGPPASVTPFPGTVADGGTAAAAGSGGDRTSAAPAPGTGPTSLQTLRALDSGPRGLLESEAEIRLGRTGENVLPARRPVPWPRRF
ncbi:cation-transporting P-type ATPase, partial [Streptomyces anulatus]|uniref:cation-transporting P-type ATPase n=1 Tax=Streptomyces anulatus TaxID=1892 RepID=UPI00331AE558